MHGAFATCRLREVRLASLCSREHWLPDTSTVAYCSPYKDMHCKVELAATTQVACNPRCKAGAAAAKQHKLMPAKRLLLQRCSLPYLIQS